MKAKQSSYIPLLLIMLFATLNSLKGQDSIAWGLQGKTKHLSNIQEVAILENGDAVFCGGHDSLITFGDYSFRGPRDKSSTGATRTSAYVGRISDEKEIRWVKQVAYADGGVYVSDLELDAFGNIYISASAGGIVHFGDGHSQNLGATGMLIAKLSPEGEFIWGRAYSGLGAKVHFYHVLPRRDGKCYVLGNHGGGTFGSSRLPAGGDGQYSQYLGLVDDKGNPLWAESIGGSGGRITATDICFSADRQVLICGNYRNIHIDNVVDESLGLAKEDTKIKTKITAGSIGVPLTSLSSSNGLVQAFIGKFNRDNGKPIEVHVYGGKKMSNITSLASDEEGNIYAGLSLYGEDLKIGGSIVHANSGTTMAIAKLDKDWNCVWHKSFDSPGADYVNDLSLDGQKLYAAALVAGSKLNTDDAIYTATGIWSGALIRINPNTGFAENVEHWEPGSALCIAMRDGKGYAGGWFHNSIHLAGETFTVGKEGQFNAILVRFGPPEEDPDTSLVAEVDTLDERRAEVQGQIEVFREDITITFWDDQEVDNDIISLKYNEAWLIKNYTLSATPKTIRLKVKPGISNHLEMIAISEGRIPPATTAIIISDGIRNHKLSLRSNPKTNGRIEIVWKQ